LTWAAVPRWHLSDRGIVACGLSRHLRMFRTSPPCGRAAKPRLSKPQASWQRPSGLLWGVHDALHENDRSATGFIPPPEFERMADAFFAHPEESVRGWERAVDAQTRIAAAVDELLDRSPQGTVAFVAHGGVGTLLLCRYLGVRSAGQPISPFRATTGPSSERRVVFFTSGGRSPPDRGAALPFTWSKRPSSLSRPSLQPHYAGTDIKRCIRWSSRIHNRF
jgi:hypothetical protein